MKLRPPSTRRPAGFTLIELVISAALMSVILASAYLCLRAGVASQQTVQARAELLQRARVALALLSADLRAACPLDKDFAFLGTHRMLGQLEGDTLDFATHNYQPRRPREGDYCELSYFVDRDPEHRGLSLWRRRNPRFAPDPLAGGQVEEIARGVQGLRLEYYDGYDWYDDWGDATGRRKQGDSALQPPNLFGMPEAVRITLRLAPAAGPTPNPGATNETALVFQTVARLNLADRPSAAAGGETATNAVPGTAAPGPAAAPPGP